MRRRPANSRMISRRSSVEMVRLCRLEPRGHEEGPHQPSTDLFVAHLGEHPPVVPIGAIMGVGPGEPTEWMIPRSQDDTSGDLNDGVHPDPPEHPVWPWSLARIADDEDPTRFENTHDLLKTSAFVMEISKGEQAEHPIEGVVRQRNRFSGRLNEGGLRFTLLALPARLAP